ncbi:uncharacterized protein V1510DRAFT_413649 [Dipodascopsis tothii]|uniref:uncharacterized protein n=1 Tax=Dipodascopsis tothii TaxID=44089 RepID=UPI0034CD3146
MDAAAGSTPTTESAPPPAAGPTAVAEDPLTLATAQPAADNVTETASVHEYTEDSDDDADSTVPVDIPTRPLWYVVVLALTIGGLQLSWSAEFSHGTPYLISLGMPRALMSLTWAAGPLSGVIVQPLVGALSDQCRSPYGRRRPFLVAGAAMTSVSLLAFAWSRDIVRVVTLGHAPSWLVQAFAVLSVYFLDFSIGIVQAAGRAFIVDNVPVHQQQSANAWAAILTGVGNIIGFILGSLELPRLFPFLGGTQFKGLAAFAVIALLGSVAVACRYVCEQPLAADEVAGSRMTLRQALSVSLRANRRLSPQVRNVCRAEFFAWIGYFPMLYYVTTFVGGIYYHQTMAGREGLPPLSTPAEDALWDEGTRLGSRALLVYSIVSLATNLVMPVLVKPSYAPNSKAWLTVARAWTLSHGVFVVLMLSTFFVRSVGQATVIVGLLGAVWAHALWAPYVLIAEDIAETKFDLAASAKYETDPGIVMAVHNVYVSLPQVVSSVAISVLFFLLGPLVASRAALADATVYLFVLGGATAIVAAVVSLRVRALGAAPASYDSLPDDAAPGLFVRPAPSLFDHEDGHHGDGDGDGDD